MHHPKLLIILIGAPGSGKGTQALEIAKKYKIDHLSTGVLLRGEIEKKSTIGKEVQEYIEQGKLVPDPIIIQVLQNHISQIKNNFGLLLDGFPRTIEQAKMLDIAVARDYSTCVIHLDVADEVVIHRLSGRKTCPSCQAIFHVAYKPPQQEEICDYCHSQLFVRNDDREETIRNRLQTFHEQTDPVIEYYQKNQKLHTVHAEKSPEEVGALCETLISNHIVDTSFTH